MARDRPNSRARQARAAADRPPPMRPAPRRALAVGWALLFLSPIACGGESGPQSSAPRPPRAEVRPVTGENIVEEGTPQPTPATSPEPEEAEESIHPPAEDPGPDPFALPLPAEPCPEAVRVAVAHRDVELPTFLEQAIAFRSEDGRHVRVVVANHPLDLDPAGRFAAPDAGQARFEMDATRTRRGPLDARVLGGPDARRGGLTHARIVTPGPLLTFGHREVGRVELTAISETQVCGRIDLNDGFGRVRGVFSANVLGPLPP